MVKFNELRVDSINTKLVIDASIRDLPYYETVYIDKIYIDTQDTYKDGGPSEEAIEFDIYPTTNVDTSNNIKTPEVYGQILNVTTFSLDFSIERIGDYILNLGEYSSETVRFKDSTGNVYSADMPPVGPTYFVFTYKEGEVILKDSFTELKEFKKAKSVRLEVDPLLLGSDLNNTMYFVYVIPTGTPAEDTPCGKDNSFSLGITFNSQPLYKAFMSYINEVISSCNIPVNFINTFLRSKAIQVSINSGHYPKAIEYYNKFIKNMPITGTEASCICHG